MTIQSMTPYLILGGQAERALQHYQQVLGATVETLQRFGDVDASCPEARRDRVMHASLRIGKALLMVSDGPDAPPPESGRVSVAVELDDPEQTRRAFAGLAETGQIVQQLFQAPWGSLFGVVRDQFGVSWMFDCALQAK